MQKMTKGSFKDLPPAHHPKDSATMAGYIPKPVVSWRQIPHPPSFLSSDFWNHSNHVRSTADWLDNHCRTFFSCTPKESKLPESIATVLKSQLPLWQTALWAVVHWNTWHLSLLYNAALLVVVPARTLWVRLDQDVFAQRALVPMVRYHFLQFGHLFFEHRFGLRHVGHQDCHCTGRFSVSICLFAIHRKISHLLSEISNQPCIAHIVVVQLLASLLKFKALGPHSLHSLTTQSNLGSAANLVAQEQEAKQHQQTRCGFPWNHRSTVHCADTAKAAVGRTAGFDRLGPKTTETLVWQNWLRLHLIAQWKKGFWTPTASEHRHVVDLVEVPQHVDEVSHRERVGEKKTLFLFAPQTAVDVKNHKSTLQAALVERNETKHNISYILYSHRSTRSWKTASWIQEIGYNAKGKRKRKSSVGRKSNRAPAFRRIAGGVLVGIRTPPAILLFSKCTLPPTPHIRRPNLPNLPSQPSLPPTSNSNLPQPPIPTSSQPPIPTSSQPPIPTSSQPPTSPNPNHLVQRHLLQELPEEGGLWLAGAGSGSGSPARPSSGSRCPTPRVFQLLGVRWVIDIRLQ